MVLLLEFFVGRHIKFSVHNSSNFIFDLNFIPLTKYSNLFSFLQIFCGLRFLIFYVHIIVRNKKKTTRFEEIPQLAKAKSETTTKKWDVSAIRVLKINSIKVFHSKKEKVEMENQTIRKISYALNHQVAGFEEKGDLFCPGCLFSTHRISCYFVFFLVASKIVYPKLIEFVIEMLYNILLPAELHKSEQQHVYYE